MYYKLIDEYFIAFENKDIEKLKNMFDDNITLFDPVVKLIQGKAQVIEVNMNIFNDCTNLNFIKKDIFIDIEKMTAIGEVEFYCNDIKINVVDIIKFNNDLKINSITAYLDTKTIENK